MTDPAQARAVISVCRVARGVLKRVPSVLKNSISKTGHRRARPWGGWLRAATLTAGVALASTAHAEDAGTAVPSVQSGTVTVTTPTRTATLRATTTKQNWISHDDCDKDIELAFPVAVSGATGTGTALTAYVSRVDTDCLVAGSRVLDSCRSLTPVENPSSAKPTVRIKAKALMTLLHISGCGEDFEDGGVQSTSPIGLKFYFMLDPGGGTLVAGTNNFAIYEDTGIDLWGPAAPTNLKVTSGDEALQLEFTSDTSSELTGFNFYADDGTGVPDGGIPTTASTSGGSGTTTGGASSSAAATTGAGSGTSTSAGTGTSTGTGGAGGASTSSTSAGVGGSSSTGGASASSTSTSAGGMGGASGVGGTSATGTLTSTGAVGTGSIDACNPTSEMPTCVAASYLLVPGQVPNYNEAGTLVGTGSTSSITNLKNGKAYVVGVAAYDEIGNVGKLSELQCGTPVPVNSILRVYKCQGGFDETGCGFCSMRGDRGGSFAALVSGGLVLLGLAARRSRRPRVAGGSRGPR